MPICGGWRSSRMNMVTKATNMQPPRMLRQCDPRDVSLLSSLGGEFYMYLRRFDEARAAVDRALQISPDSETSHAIKAGILQNEGRLPEAAQELARVPESSTED